MIDRAKAQIFDQHIEMLLVSFCSYISRSRNLVKITQLIMLSSPFSV